MSPRISRVCVFCASSTRCDPEHHRAAEELGRLLARQGIEIVHGGGRVGSMGALADGALAEGGRVHGVIPRFMHDLGWGHPGHELRIVGDMHVRKRIMTETVEAVVALPGGCGTMEELLEIITWKRLGLFVEPIVLLNVRGFFDPLLELLSKSVDEKFMDERHLRMWSVVDSVESVLPAIVEAPPWEADARSFASVT